VKAVKEIRGVLCCVEACEALGLSRATYYRSTRKVERGETIAVSRAPHPRALASAERQELLDHLHSPRFVDRSVPQVYATLLDEKTCRFRSIPACSQFEPPLVQSPRCEKKRLALGDRPRAYIPSHTTHQASNRP